ncbi:MAG: DUF6089 family protein [Bacteroidia bacterium]
MKKILLLFVSIIPAIAYSQTNEIGVEVGASNYLGDLAPSIAIRETHPEFGAYIKKNRPNGFVSWKYGLYLATISGNDQNFKQNQTRNLDFKSQLIEASVQFEFNFQKFFIGLRAEDFSPYIFAGLGATYFNPKGTYNGEYINLKPLSTEGQGLPNGPKPYSNFSAVAPVGIGTKWVIGRRWNLYAHTGFRFSFTDYLDDVSGTYYDNSVIFESKGNVAAYMANKSPDQIFITDKQRGNPQRNDWYFFTGVSISYWLLDKECFNFK